MDPRKHGKKVASIGKGLDSEREESPLPPLFTKRDAKQLVITSFFRKSPVKKEIKKDTRKQRPKEKGKEKVTDVTGSRRT